MLKRISAFMAGLMFLCGVGGVVYADSSGVFLQDNEAAKQLIDRYVSFIMKNYVSDSQKVSFRGIVKEGCDFWYYNDYNNKKIAETKACNKNYEVDDVDYSIRYDSVSYNNKCYTIDATVTSTFYYKNSSEKLDSVCRHTFTIEQNGNSMYIVNDDSDDLPFTEIIKKETDDTP